MLNKIEAARKTIRAQKLKKDGFNDYSKYNYFTPEVVEKWVTDACTEHGLTFIFNLKADEFGLYGELTVYDLEKETNFPKAESLTTVMRTVMPSIKATNETQQMGGCMTYTRRYMLMSLFGIMDNSLDFDSHDNRPKQPTKPTSKPSPTDAAFLKLVAKVRDEGKTAIEKAKQYFSLTGEQLQQLEVVAQAKGTK